MSRNIAHLTGIHEGAIAKFIRQAEELCGYPSEDVRLIAETSQKLKAKIAQLGLDPQDTTNKELYWALRAKAGKDSENFAKLCGLNDQNNRADRLIDIFRHAEPPVQVFTLRKSAAKNILREVPPKQLMKKLGYRSVESMLKREDASSLFSVISASESLLWKQKFNRKLKNLSANDFEERSLELIKLSAKFEPLSQGDINTCYLMGAVIINARKAELAGRSGLTDALELLESVQRLRSWSAAAALKRLSPGFGSFVAEHTSKEPKQAALFYDAPIEFNNLHSEEPSHLAKLAGLSLPLSWWKDNHAIASMGRKKPVSLNLQDVLDDHYAQSDFASRGTDKLQSSFWQELVKRYLQHSSFRAEILKSFDQEAVMAEDSFDNTSLQRFLEAV